MFGNASPGDCRERARIGPGLTRIKDRRMRLGNLGSMTNTLANGRETMRRHFRRWRLWSRALAVIIALMLVLSPFAGGTASHAMHGPEMNSTAAHSDWHKYSGDEVESCCHATMACAHVFLISADQSVQPVDATGVIFDLKNSRLGGRESVPDPQPPTT